MGRSATEPSVAPEMRNWPECETERKQMADLWASSSLRGCLKSNVHSYSMPGCAFKCVLGLGCVWRSRSGQPRHDGMLQAVSC
eukprot:2417294-Rhodomonas_salina.3